MVKGISGVVLADKIAENRLTESDKKTLAARKEEQLKKQNLWKEAQEKKQEFGRGYQIELEKERRVKAGLPEYDIQQSTDQTAVSSKKKGQTAEEIIQKQKGSEELGQLRNESRAKALIAKAEHQAQTQSASGKHIHKELKEAEKLDPGSTKGINEKKLIEKAGEDIKPVAKETKTANIADDVVDNLKKTGKTSGKKSLSKLGKLGKFAKKAGKFGLIGLVGAALISGAAYAIGKLLSGDDKVKEDKTPAPAPTQPDKTNPKEENKPAPTNPDDKTDPKDKVNPNPVPTNPDDKTDPKDKVNPNPAPTNPDDKTDPKDKVNPNPAPTNPDDKTDPDPAKSKTEHVVVKGDNVWNIAKQHLKEMNPDPNYKPTNAEILKHTQELMELNQLKFEPDGYVVLIRPNDRIKLVA